MTIHLPDDLESSIRAAVDDGQFASVDDAMAEAARLLLRGSDQMPSTKPFGVAKIPGPDSSLGSIGSMRDAAVVLDEIVANAYRRRREEAWRDVSVE